jgi:hypothetical protein
VIERNRIFDSQIGIRFGYTEGASDRVYPDHPCGDPDPVTGHFGGVARNNIIYVSTEVQPPLDSGFSLWATCGTDVVHNTVVSEEAPFSSIEWRYAGTQVSLTNNLVSHNLRDRDGTALQAGNVTGALPSWFVGAARRDLHLDRGASAAIDRGVELAPGLCDEDMDRQPRNSEAPDVGADEL